MESSDKAWEMFVANSKTESVAKASLADKLDILASQLNEVVTNTRNVAKLAPELMGDQSAIDAANAMAPPGDMGMDAGEEGMGGLPDPEEFADEMTSQLGGEGDMTNPDEEMIDEQGAPMEDVPPEMPPEMPPTEEGAAPPMPEAPMPDETIPPMPEVPMEDVPPEMPMPEMENTPPAMDMYTSDVAFEDLIMTLSDELHDATDAGDYVKAQAIAKKLEVLQATWDGFGDVPITEDATTTAGAEDMVPPEVIDALAGGAAPEIPPEIPPEALMKSEKEDAPKEDKSKNDGEEDEKKDEPKAEAEDDDGFDDDFMIEEEMAEEGPLPEVDPMVQGLMGLMQILDTGDIEGAKAMIAALLEGAAPVAKSEDVPEGDMGGDMGGESESVAMSDDEDVLTSDSEDVEKGCDSVEKSEQFHMESITELIARRNGYNSPNTASGVGGNIMRPSANPFAIRKSAIGTGTYEDPLRASVNADWERYKLYKHKDSF